MDSLLQVPPAAILNSNLAATPLNSREDTRPRAAATHQRLVVDTPLRPLVLGGAPRE